MGPSSRSPRAFRTVSTSTGGCTGRSANDSRYSTARSAAHVKSSRSSPTAAGLSAHALSAAGFDPPATPVRVRFAGLVGPPEVLQPRGAVLEAAGAVGVQPQRTVVFHEARQPVRDLCAGGGRDRTDGAVAVESCV